MLEFSSDLVIVVDSDGKILQVNEHVPALLNMKREALTGLRVQEIDNPFIHNLWSSLQEHKTQSKTGDSTVFSSIVRGELRHFRLKQVPTVFENGSDGYTYNYRGYNNPEKIPGDAGDQRGEIPGVGPVIRRGHYWHDNGWWLGQLEPAA